MRLSELVIKQPTTRRLLLKGLVGASALAAGLRGGLARGQDAPALQPATLKRPLTLFVGGLDTRAEGEPENSDVLMLARVDVTAKTFRAVSIPRDLWVTIPGFGEEKITRAYDFGSKTQNGMFKPGAELLKATIAQNFGLELDGVVLTTFGGFERIVDALGGVDVVNPYAVSDDEYPTVDYGYSSIYFPDGPQRLTGADALVFCRTRHQDGDPGRVMRQQIVMRAMLRRSQEPDIAPVLTELVAEHRRAVKTDLGPSKQLAFALAAPDFAVEDVALTTLQDYVYDDVAATGAWIYSGNWAEIPGFIEGVLSGAIDDPSYYAEPDGGLPPEEPVAEEGVIEPIEE